MNNTATATMTTLSTTEALDAAGVPHASSVVAAVIADHALLDVKGRKVGGKAVVIQLAEGASAKFGVKSFALRNGQEFGATPTKYASKCEDLATAIKAAEKAMQAQRKRYAKLAAGPTR